MTEFKGISTDVLSPKQKEIADGNFRPLFGGDGFEAGLAELDDGSIVEIKRPEWSLVQDEPQCLRAMPLRLHMADSGIEFVPSSPWNPEHPSLGSETELVVAELGKGWWNVLPDGHTLQWPDGSSQPITDTLFTAELLKRNIEYSTEPVYGFERHAAQVGRVAEQVSRMLDSHGLIAPPLSVNPDSFSEDDISTDPWIQEMAFKRMEHIYEFGCLSVQLHVQMRDLESGARALNNYQAVQALVSMITAAGPIRDGRFDTTLSRHYLENPNPDFVIPDDAVELIGVHGDIVPDDWRELSRRFGSPSSGAYASPVPMTVDDLLRKADKGLDAGDLVSSVRVLGWHTDRMRLDHGTLEICNIGTAGGNLHKLTATQLLVGKFMVALQEYGARTGQSPASLFGSTDTLDARAIQCETGHSNNMFAALYGKEHSLILPDGRSNASPAELLRRMTDVINKNTHVGLSPAHSAELQATLQPAPTAADYRKADADTVLADFYKPESRMTATEALRLAHEVEPHMPVQRLLDKMALHHAAHVRQWNNR